MLENLLVAAVKTQSNCSCNGRLKLSEVRDLGRISKRQTTDERERNAPTSLQQGRVQRQPKRRTRPRGRHLRNMLYLSTGPFYSLSLAPLSSRVVCSMQYVHAQFSH